LKRRKNLSHKKVVVILTTKRENVSASLNLLMSIKRLLREILQVMKTDLVVDLQDKAVVAIDPVVVAEAAQDLLVDSGIDLAVAVIEDPMIVDLKKRILHKAYLKKKSRIKSGLP
jgi:hypothetical protein